MVETIAVKQTLIRINKYDFPYDVVRSILGKIDFHTMEYVLECSFFVLSWTKNKKAALGQIVQKFK